MSKIIREFGELSQGLSSTLVEWKIRQSLRLLPKMDYKLESPCFCFLDAVWVLEMNIKSSSGDYVGLSLKCDHLDIENHRIRYKLTMRTKDGTKLSSICQEADFSRSIPNSRCTKFVAKSKLVRGETEFNPEGLIIISCELCAHEFETTKSESQIESQKGLYKLGENFKELFLSGKDSNITLSVKDCKFKCHRGILAARSSVFANMLMQNKLEMTTGVIEIEDCEPEAFQEFLIYLYSGSGKDFTEGNAFGLYHIADKYEEPEVKARCVQLLTTSLRVKNFCDVVDLALRHNDSELLQITVTFYAKNTKSILVTHSWQDFLKRNPIAANELHLKCLDEDNTMDMNTDKSLSNIRGVNKLGENFKELFLREEGSDITLCVRDRKFMCHRAVLFARSSMFVAMLGQDMLQKTTGIVKIDDCEPEAFREFLIYLYSGSVKDFTEGNAFFLYQIADKYKEPEVKAKCVHLLTTSLCVKNFCDVVDLALRHNDQRLFQIAVTFFAKNTKSILVTLSWQNFLKKDPIAANELHLKCLEDNTLNTNEDETQFNTRGANKLGQNLKELFLSKEGSDITLSVRDQKFMCHRAVLSARSPVFAAMLREDMLEKTTGIVEIDDCEPEAFQEFLTFLYSGCEEDFTKKNIFGLYRIADKYDVPEVKASCVHLLTIDLCVKNFCDVVDLAFQYNESELLQTAVIFFVQNAKDILVTASWQNFMKVNSIGANDLFLTALDIKLYPIKIDTLSYEE